MANVAVVGTQWGDEGKGKVVDYLSAKQTSWSDFKAGTTQVTPWLSVGRRRSVILSLQASFTKAKSVLSATGWCSILRFFSKRWKT